MTLVGDELEYAISQHLDGQLSAEMAVVLEERFATDPAARELLREYQHVHATLASAPKLPELDWDALSRETARQCAAEYKSVYQKPVFGRFFPKAFGRDPESNTIGRIGFFVPLGLAASLLIGGGVALLVSHPHGAPAPAARPIVAQVHVSGPTAEAPTVAVVEQVKIGDAPTVAANSYRNTDDVVDRPSIVLINRADDPTPDSDSLY